MYLGIDVGGTNTKLCVVDTELHILKGWELATEKSLDIVEFLDNLIAESRMLFPCITHVGLGFPGTVDPETGSIHTAPAIFAGERNIKRELSARVGIEVSVENDVACWAIAEGECGCCRGVSDYVFITIGTGIGSCIVINGQIYKGSDLAAGEIGYMVFLEDLQGQARSFDEFGSFESKASAAAIERDYRASINSRATVAEIYERFKDSSDAAAQSFICQKMDYLAVGIANIVTILNPQTVVIAGGITKEWDFLNQQLSARLKRLVHNQVSLQHNQTGEYGGALGAVIHALKNHTYKNNQEETV